MVARWDLRAVLPASVQPITALHLVRCFHPPKPSATFHSRYRLPYVVQNYESCGRRHRNNRGVHLFEWSATHIHQLDHDIRAVNNDWLFDQQQFWHRGCHIHLHSQIYSNKGGLFWQQHASQDIPMGKHNHNQFRVIDKLQSLNRNKYQ